jgi:hypothetical protein
MGSDHADKLFENQPLGGPAGNVFAREPERRKPARGQADQS